jgi:hypothetical protein
MLGAVVVMDNLNNNPLFSSLLLKKNPLFLEFRRETSRTS